MTSTTQHPSYSDGRHSGHDHNELNPATEAQLRRVIADAIDCLEHQLADGALSVLRSVKTGVTR